MPKLQKWTIAIASGRDRSLKKISKVVGLSDGGFTVLSPYHSSRSGFVMKMPIGPEILRKMEYQVRFDECVSFSANDRVKLSYHADGFAQFSGEASGKIISGRDQITGEPRGLGLMARPLVKPSWTGGSAGITVWGLHDYLDVDEHPNLVYFEPGEIYYRDCTPSNATAWHIRIYAFSRSDAVPPLRFRGNSAVFQVAGGPLSGGLRDVVEMKHLDLRGPAYLGVSVHAFKHRFKAASGWQLSGPGDWSATKPGHVLMGFYPRDATLEAVAKGAILDYARKGENEPG